jgi:histidinol-phosphate/aromatic aminotransferase/cobyric acid decarboxylase-like protein
MNNTTTIKYNDPNSALFALFGSLKSTLCYIYAPITPIYSQVLKKYNFLVEDVNIYLDMQKEIVENSIVVFQNPTYADGKYFNLEDTIALWVEKKCIIIIDESFLEFTSNKSQINKIQSYSDLYIVSGMEYFYKSYNIFVTTITSSISNIKILENDDLYIPLSRCNIDILNNIKLDKSYNKTTRVINLVKNQKLYNFLQNENYIADIFISSTNHILIRVKYNAILPSNLNYKNTKNIMFLDDNYKIVIVD